MTISRSTRMIGLILGIGLALPGLQVSAEPGGEASTSSGRVKIVFVAGPPSHAYAQHEYFAGCTLLADSLRKAAPNVEATVCKNGYPKDPGILASASAIVFYADGLARHPVMGHLEEIDRIAKRGVGLAFLHYALLLPEGKASEYLRDWIGGCYETHWSVNPFWTAEFNAFPNHAATRGVRPFSIRDEWYFNMRFVPGMKGVTPLLTATPPDSARQGPDGPHSGNPYVRSHLGTREHMAWAYVRAGGGRGFGFTGGDPQWNWANNGFRTLVLNAIAWTAGIDVPANGIPSSPPTLEMLEANQDKPQPAGFDREKVRRMIRQWQNAEK